MSICEKHARESRSYLIKILQFLGMTVTSVSDGKYALDLILKNTPNYLDLIVTDLRMRMMSGQNLIS